MIDVVDDPAVTHRRRRLEWPQPNESFFQRLYERASNPIPPEVAHAVDQVIADEFSKCGGDNEGFFEDVQCMDELVAVPLLKRRPVNKPALLHALYFRGRQQSAIWDTYCALVQKKFVDSRGLLVPVDFRTVSSAVGQVSRLLSCFEYVNRYVLPLNDQDQPYELYSYPGFPEPIRWLATMIVRGCSDVTALFETIQKSMFLGPLNQEAYQKYMAADSDKSFTVNPLERQGKHLKSTHPFGFWLPQGIQGESQEAAYDSIYTDHIMRFNVIEKTFKQYFNITDKEIVLEEEEELSYKRFPEMLPGHKSSS
ncbi:MAG: hypothetical protein Q9201_001472 [Fulgogasparrea decipioides]